MPSFDIVSRVDSQEVANAINQARKEITTRFDFRGKDLSIEILKDHLELRAEDEGLLKALREIVIGKLARRNIDLRNLDQKTPEISPLGKARQEIHILQGIDHLKAKEIQGFIRSLEVKVQPQHQDQQIRVTGKKRDDLQSVIASLKGRDFGIALSFVNFRD